MEINAIPGAAKGLFCLKAATLIAGAHTDTALQHKVFTAAGCLLQRSWAAAHLYPQIGIAAGEHFCSPSCSSMTAPGTSTASSTALGDRGLECIIY